MEEEKNILDFTQDEMIKYIQTQRRIYVLEEYQSMKTDLLDRVKRTLDLRDLMKITMSNHKRVRRIINKYAKPCKKEADTRKLLKKQELEENMIGTRYVSSVMDLMELVYKVLYTEAFEKDLPTLEKWYEFEMEDMVKSVKEYGVILPVIVRPKEDGTYEMISGHRRKLACELAGMKQIRCIVKNLTDDEATILMVDTNIQREEILPSEKVFAYKMKLEAMKHQGKRVDLEEDTTSDPMGWKLESANKLGAEVGESMTNLRRYIRLTYLIPEFLEQVDNKRIAFRPAVELSYLSKENQYVVQNIFEFFRNI